MVGWIGFGLVCASGTAHAEDGGDGGGSAAPVDVSAALEKPKKGKWDPKGKAIDPYGRGDAKRKQEAWTEAVPLLVDAVEAQPGCGKCLHSLSRSLTGAKQFDDAVKVAQLMTELFPDHDEGWFDMADAYAMDDKTREAIDATSKFLEVETSKDDSAMWWQRNRLLLQLADYEGAQKWLAGTDAAGLPKEDAACLKVEILAATDRPVDARELWPSCDASTNADLKRYTEGWIALAEGDAELAAKKLVMAGTDNFGRLTIAFIRIDEGKFDMAHNLAEKLLEDDAWALDGFLVEAEALHGLGKDAEATAILDGHLMGADWAAKHAAWGMQDVLLKPKGESWPKEVGQRAAALKAAILAASGDTVGAGAFAAEVAKVNGDSPRLQAALDTPIGNTGVGRKQLTDAVVAAVPALKKCYEKEKKKTPTLAGQVVVGFTLGADGTVSGAAAKSNTLSAAAPDLEKCTVDEVGKMKLPVTAGAAAAQVTWAIAFPM